MRSDYEYIDKATAICLTTTKRGRDFLEENDSELVACREKRETRTAVLDLLMAIDEHYFEVKPDRSFFVWYGVYRVKYECHFGEYPLLTFDQFMYALQLGYMTVKKVIWD